MYTAWLMLLLPLKLKIRSEGLLVTTINNHIISIGYFPVTPIEFRLSPLNCNVDPSDLSCGFVATG